MRTSPTRLFLLTLAGAAIGALAMWAAMSTPRKAAQIAHPGLDLRDRDARFAFVSFLRSERTTWDYSLIDDCGLRNTEVFRVTAFTAFRNPEAQLAELRLKDNSPVGATYQIPPPLHDTNEAPSPSLHSAPRSVSFQEFEKIKRLAAHLSDDNVPLTHGTLGLDGSSVTLEFCNGTQYGFYHLYNPAANREQDVRIVEVANAILASVGESPIAMGVDVSIKSTN